MLSVLHTLRMRAGGADEERGGTKNQKPERREWQGFSAVKRKCELDGRSLMPEKVRGALGVVRVRRSIPRRLEGGRFARRRVGVGGDKGVGMTCCRKRLEKTVLYCRVPISNMIRGVGVVVDGFNSFIGVYGWGRIIREHTSPLIEHCGSKYPLIAYVL